MSRKDPRAVLIVPLAPGWRSALRARAKRGSLGDVVRRIVADRIDDYSPSAIVVQAHSTLPVQLPRKLLIQVSDLARQTGQSPADLVAQILHHALSADPTP